MRTISLFLALLVLCLGPGWTQDIPLPRGADGPTTEIFAAVDHQAESPAWTIRLEPPERSLLDAQALVDAPRAGPDTGPAAQRGRLPLGSAPSPSLHLKLCVFLC